MFLFIAPVKEGGETWETHWMIWMIRQKVRDKKKTLIPLARNTVLVMLCSYRASYADCQSDLPFLKHVFKVKNK